MKKYVVGITEEFRYYVEVEADSKGLAEELAFDSPKFINDMFDENDSRVDYIEEINED
jgi:hypothetical protein